MVRELGGGDEHFRMVIFVDDLDRCQGPAMFRLMESMKLFFDVPGVVFVVGAAIAPLRQAVSEHYGENLDPEQITRADLYVEKIFPTQMRVSVPIPPILDRFAAETNCPFLNEQEPIYDHASNVSAYGPMTLSDGLRVTRDVAGSNSGAHVVRFWLMSFFDAWGLRSPRVVKMWLDALDRYIHSYVSLRARYHASEWEDRFRVPELAWAIEGLVLLAWELRGRPNELLKGTTERMTFLKIADEAAIAELECQDIYKMIDELNQHS